MWNWIEWLECCNKIKRKIEKQYVVSVILHTEQQKRPEYIEQKQISISLYF